MEERILQLLEGLKSEIVDMRSDMGVMKSEMSAMKSEVGSLRSEIGDMKSEVGSLKSDVGDIKSEVGSLKSDVGELKSDVSSLRSEMHSRFDRVDHLLEGIGGQFEHQTSQRIAEGQAISNELTSIKLRIFDLETKTMK